MSLSPRGRDLKEAKWLKSQDNDAYIGIQRRSDSPTTGVVTITFGKDFNRSKIRHELYHGGGFGRQHLLFQHQRPLGTCSCLRSWGYHGLSLSLSPTSHLWLRPLPLLSSSLWKRGELSSISPFLPSPCRSFLFIIQILPLLFLNLFIVYKLHLIAFPFKTYVLDLKTRSSIQDTAFCLCPPSGGQIYRRSRLRLLLSLYPFRPYNATDTTPARSVKPLTCEMQTNISVLI